MGDPQHDKGMFVDEVDISVAGGSGGRGCVSFRREKFVPKGGPDGGDGGNGGSVHIVADDSYNTLQHLAGHHHWRADNGKMGLGKNCAGKRGQDIEIRVPPGTIVYDAVHKVRIKDLGPGERVMIAAGGKGGKGNTHFKNSVNQAPRTAEPGEPGEQREIHLELKLIADVGLVGKPNAGKSTLLSRLSSARPKIAAYPFTTRYPVLGIVEMPGFRRFVMADIPGLIEGAHEGAGLGDEFLRHIERTRVLVHMLDIEPPAGDPADDYKAIRRELEQYSPALAAKPEIIVANKMDLTDSDKALARLRRRLRGKEIYAISAVAGKGLLELAKRLWDELHPDEA
jgi:GTP-binding protein